MTEKGISVQNNCLLATIYEMWYSNVRFNCLFAIIYIFYLVGIEMNIQIIAVGKLKEKYLVDGIKEYMKRLAPYSKISIQEVADEKVPETLSPAQEQQAKEREGERILAFIKPETYVIALAIDGKLWSSEDLAEQIGSLATYGRSQIAFVIGGSLGLSQAVLQRADQKLSFGRLTYPHQLMRLILVEQIYRAFKIIRGEPYHK